MPMPRLTRLPLFNSWATRRAMMICGSMISSVRNEVVDERCRRDDVIGCGDADRHDMLRRHDHGIRRHGHDRIEIACGERVGEVAEVIGEEGVDQRKLRANGGFEQEWL